jgi:hypothetical protein
MLEFLVLPQNKHDTDNNHLRFKDMIAFNRTTFEIATE